MNTDPTSDAGGERLTRRRTLTRLGGLVAASFGAAGLEAALSNPAAGAANGPAAVAAGLVSCVLAPEHGPFCLCGPIRGPTRQIAPWAERRKAPFAGLSGMGREGFEPSTLGLRVPCSTN